MIQVSIDTLVVLRTDNRKVNVELFIFDLLAMFDCTDILIDDQSYQQQNDDLLFSSLLAKLHLFQVEHWTNCSRSLVGGGVDDEML